MPLQGPLAFLATLALILALLRLYYWRRAHAMQSLARRLGFRYIGPALSPHWLRNPAHFKSPPPLPTWIPHIHPHGERIRQVWNVLEGEKDGIAIFVFDAVIGELKTHPCTVIAAHTTQSRFPRLTRHDRLLESNGWTILHGSWLLWFSWTMSTHRLERHIDGLNPAPHS